MSKYKVTDEYAKYLELENKIESLGGFDYGYLISSNVKMIFKKLYMNKVDYSIWINDSNNNQIYIGNGGGYWFRREFDSNNNVIYRENSDGFWVKSEFDSNNNRIYYEDSDGDWFKSEFDSNSLEIYCECSDGTIRGKRPNKK